METEKIILQLANQVETIKAHINRIKKPGYSIHELDADLLRKKTLEFYDLVNCLSDNVAPKKGQVAYVPKKEHVKIKEEVVESEAVEEIHVEEPEKISVKEKEIEKVVVAPSVIENVPPVVVEDKPAAPEPAPIVEDEVVNVAPKPDSVITDDKLPVIEEEVAEDVEITNHAHVQTTYDLFSENGDNTVIEKLITHDEVSIADKMQKTKISNIREAIGINDKFLFINGLFNGDLSRYNKILDEFNELTTKQGVDTYLREVKVQFRWDEETDAYARFREILDRKFA